MSEGITTYKFVFLVIEFVFLVIASWILHPLPRCPKYLRNIAHHGILSHENVEG
jgi:hypothetical protein